MPEALAAADELAGAGIAADVLCLTSADLVFRAVQARQGLHDGSDAILDVLLPAAAHRADRHRARRPSAHARVPRCVGGAPIASLGTTDFGQSGDVEDLYRSAGIDVDTIVGVAADLAG